MRAAGITEHSISIHAPAKGATVVWVLPLLLHMISIHAPAKGATSLRIISRSVSEFQSTLP